MILPSITSHLYQFFPYRMTYSQLSAGWAAAALFTNLPVGIEHVMYPSIHDVTHSSSDCTIATSFPGLSISAT